MTAWEDIQTEVRMSPYALISALEDELSELKERIHCLERLLAPPLSFWDIPRTFEGELE